MRYTQQEQDVIRKHVRVNTSNLRQGFADAAIELGRTFQSVQAHYYGQLRPVMQREFALKNHGRLVSNTKNTPRVLNPAKAIAIAAKQLTKRQTQKRKTAKCVSETARLKARLQSLSKLLQ